MRFSVHSILGPVLILSSVILFTGQRLYVAMMWQAFAAFGVLPDSLSLDIPTLVCYGGSGLLFLLGLALSCLSLSSVWRSKSQ